MYMHLGWEATLRNFANFSLYDACPNHPHTPFINHIDQLYTQTHLSFSHEEIDGLFREVIENVCMKWLRYDLCHQPRLALNQTKEHSGRDNECRTTIQMLIKHTPSACTGLR